MIVDIKSTENGKQLVTYPNGEIIPYLEGYVTKAYYKQIGNSKQLKVVIFNEGVETTLNVLSLGITHDDLVGKLIINKGKIRLTLVNKDGQYPYAIFELTHI